MVISIDYNSRRHWLKFVVDYTKTKLVALSESWGFKNAGS